MSDLLSKVAKSGKKTEPKNAKPARQELQLNDAYIQEVFKRWIEASNVFTLVEARKDNMAQEVSDYCVSAISEWMLANKSFPGNPKLELKNDKNEPDISAIFQMQDRYTIKKGEGETTAEMIVSSLIDMGVPSEAAEKIVANELTFTSVTGARPLNELLEGHFEDRRFVEATELEKTAGEKIAKFLLCDAINEEIKPLTDEEREVTIRTTSKIVVKKGFLERIITYANTLDEIKAIFKVITPISFPSHPKFGISDTPPVRSARLVRSAADILGVDVEEKGNHAFVVNPVPNQAA
jgi:hypothetical protein